MIILQLHLLPPKAPSQSEEEEKGEKKKRVKCFTWSACFLILQYSLTEHTLEDLAVSVYEPKPERCTRAHSLSPPAGLLLRPSRVSPLLPGPPWLSTAAASPPSECPMGASIAQTQPRTFSADRFSRLKMLSSKQSLREPVVPGASAPVLSVLSFLSQVTFRSSPSSPAATVSIWIFAPSRLNQPPVYLLP